MALRCPRRELSGQRAAAPLHTDSLSIADNAVIDAGTGSVALLNRTAGTAIDPGRLTLSTARPDLGLSDLELDAIRAARLTIGQQGLGRRSITVSANVSPAAFLTWCAQLDVALNADLAVSVKADHRGDDATVAGQEILTASPVAAGRSAGPTMRWPQAPAIRSIRWPLPTPATLAFHNASPLTIGVVDSVAGLPVAGIQHRTRIGQHGGRPSHRGRPDRDGRCVAPQRWC